MIERPLAGCRVLVTRPAERGSDWARCLEAEGARVDARPTIALAPPRDAERVRRTLAELARYDWTVFTSPAGVGFFLAALAAHGFEPRWRARIAAVGPGTAGALADGGRVADLVARRSAGSGLAAALLPRLVAGASVLVIRPEVADEALARALGSVAQVEAVPFYRNVPAPDIEHVADDLCRGCYDAALFSSPSTFERLLQLARPSREQVAAALRRVRIVALGPVTARALARSGLAPAAVCTSPSAAAVVAALRQACAG